ncbi:hypothetical protein GCM10012275_33030 [Longimycelium tulufanense]|uniref:SH3 domain-containing protein n=1 Tax=Longimycelium tulufanense TaxID=907463 RepID=A0A8J3CFT9_9PSEU|nr:SH3 domain-containing protein [Longimycelium tulufanense]GGM59255.1 hypothetical protein GCM10012275_33030 [Longimycelium tulufanense]
MAVPIRPVIVAVALGAVALALVASPRDGKQNEPNPVSPASERNQCEFRVTADLLNVRSGPGTGERVVDTLRNNMLVAATDQTERGFRKLSEGRWASEKFLRAAPGNACR